MYDAESVEFKFSQLRRHLKTPEIQPCRVGCESYLCYEYETITTSNVLKARSHDPFLKIQFLVPKTGSRCSDGPISRFLFSGENVGRSFAVCSHDPLSRTNKESSIWCPNDHAKHVGAFHLSRRVSDENRACSISIQFFKIKDPFDGRSF